MEVDHKSNDAGIAGCSVMKRISVDRSALTYALSTVVFIEWLIALENCLKVLETWYLLHVEVKFEAEWRAITMEMMLVIDHHEHIFYLTNLLHFISS